jgi:hypothetical protein
MKKFLKIGTIIAVANLLLFWTAYGLLVTAWPHTGLSQFLGFSPPPAVPHWLVFCMWAFVVLGAPGSIILDGTGGDHFIFLLVLSSVLNCILWGLCLGFPIYALTKRLHSHIAQSGRPEGFPSGLPHHRTCGSAYGGS